MPDLDWPALVAHSHRLAAYLPVRFDWLGWADAEDIAAEALARAWRHRDDLIAERAEAWLNRIAFNLAKDLARRWYRRVEAPSLDALAAVVPCDADGPDRITERRETVAEVRAVLSLLPDAHRRALIASADGYSSHWSQSLGIPASTARTHAFRGRAEFRSYWRDVA